MPKELTGEYTPTQRLYHALTDELPTCDIEETDWPDLIEALDTIAIREFNVIIRWFGLGREVNIETGMIDYTSQELTDKKDTDAKKELIVLSGCRRRSITTCFQVGGEKESISQIANSFGVSGTRIRQIRDKALKKLRHQSRLKRIEKLFVPRVELRTQIQSLVCENDQLQRQVDQLHIELAQIQKKYNELANSLSQDSLIEVNNSLTSMTIDNLDLSVRTFNCLKHAGIDTVDQLLSRSKSKIMIIRNLGSRSFKELQDKLDQLGLSFEEED